jgi:DNA polymerase III delta prime subunit
MNSFLLTGADAQSRQQYMGDIATVQTELIHLVAEKTTLTIKQVKDLQIPLSVAARIPRIVWIEQANLLTIPAQNALLKMLEEPPELTRFYLSCQSPAMLLPTIRSRTKVITLEKIENNENPSILADLKAVMAQTPGDRLSSIVKRDRAESIVWFTQIEAALKDKLHGKVSPASAATLAKIAKSALQAHRELLANCSVGLVTQVFYLSLPKTK